MTTNRSDEELKMRQLIVPKLRARFPGARIIHELPLRYSSNRIDLAAITETEIISVEIKSSRDVITRLAAQLRAFAPISSRMIVALAPKWNEQLPYEVTQTADCTTYRPRFTETQEVIRAIGFGWLETWTVDADKSSIELTDGGYGKNTPWTAAMLHMLHVSELADIADRHQIAAGKRPTHNALFKECFDLMTGREIIKAVCRALRERAAFAQGTDAPIGVPA